MPSVSRDLRLFLEDMEAACACIQEYTDGLSRSGVLDDKMRFDAVLMNLYVIDVVQQSLYIIDANP